MNSLINGIIGISQKICSSLPQNEHVQKISAIEDQKKKLRTDKIFQKTMVEIQGKLQTEKEQCINALTVLNGSFFQDPSSWLKRRWDTVVKTVNVALNLKIQHQRELQTVLTQLDSLPFSSQEIEEAKSAINTYVRFEKQRDTQQKRLLEIICIESSGNSGVQESLKTELEALKARQKQLCGNYYKDPQGLLHQAWNASRKNLTDKNVLNYDLLERERKAGAAKISALQKQIDASSSLPGKSIEDLTNEEIQLQLKTLEEAQAKETALIEYEASQSRFL